MTTFRSLRLFIFLCVLASFLLSAASPFPAYLLSGQAQKEPDLVRFTIENRTSKRIALYMEGPAIYYLRVEGNSSKDFTVERGNYTYTAHACGASAKGTIELTNQKTLIMPVCGGSARSQADSSEGYVEDLSKVIHIVKITFENKASTKSLVILTGPSTYVFSHKKDESKNYTIAKGEYKVTYYACGLRGITKFVADYNTKLELSCPPR